ncbi:MAG: isoaspartyl peptidase/L-asparaginase, partial [Bacteroidota bacterium]
YKVRGRVGDTPVIGAGLFVDNEVGAAAGTGRGELILQICGSFFIVEKMREGRHPQAACEMAVQRILTMRDRGQIRNPDGLTFQAGFIAVNKQGEHGAASIKKGFPHALYRNGKNELVESKYFLEE